MKKALSLLLVGLLAAGTALAGRPAANIRFHSERGVPFAVLLDGQPLTRGLVQQVRAERMAPGMHYVDFSVPTGRSRAVRLQSRIWLEPGLETSFVLIARPGRPLSLQRAGAVALYRPGYRAPGRYDRNPAYGRTDGAGGYGNGYGSSTYPSGSYNQLPAQASAAGQDESYDRNPAAPASGSYYPGPAATNAVLATGEVQGLVQALSRTTYEDAQMQMARQALNQRRIYTEDLAQLLRSLRTDESRVELARFAYPQVVDQQNFHKIYSAFAYSSSVREVQEAVATR